MTPFRPSLLSSILGAVVLSGALAGCSRQDASSSAAEASQPMDQTNRTRATGSTGGPAGESPAARDAAAASASTSSQTTGTSPMPGPVTRPPEGSPNSRGGTGSAN